MNTPSEILFSVHFCHLVKLLIKNRNLSGKGIIITDTDSLVFGGKLTFSLKIPPKDIPPNGHYA